MIKRVLRLAAPVALALMIGAPAAFAISPISDQKCLFPSNTADDLDAALFFGVEIDTFGLDEKECKKLCKELDKLCKKNSKGREKCLKDDDKTYFKVEKELCKADNQDDKDARKACEDNVKAAEQSCKDDQKTEKEDGKNNCQDFYGKDSDCIQLCQDGQFPFSGGP